MVFYIAGSFVGRTFLTSFCPAFYAQCDELHWTCSILHIFIWILIEQTHKFICIFIANSVLLEMAIHILCILSFVVLCLHSFIFNKNLWQVSYFVSLRKVMESLPDEMIKYSSHREQRCINRWESNYESSWNCWGFILLFLMSVLMFFQSTVTSRSDFKLPFSVSFGHIYTH